jgi:WD40 repeat protein
LGPAEDAGEDWDGAIMSLDFLPDGDLLSCGGAGIRRWDLEHGSSEVLYEGPCIILEPLPGGRRSVFATRRQDGRGRLFILDLETHEVRLRQGWEDSPQALALSADGAFVATGHNSGTVLVGRVEDGIPYRLYGHDSAVFNLAFSPDGRTIASSERDGVTRVRSVPDMSKPPLNGLPLGELLAKLDTHTNIRMVRDEDSSTGWTQEVGPFPGWAEVPEW